MPPYIDVPPESNTTGLKHCRVDRQRMWWLALVAMIAMALILLGCSSFRLRSWLASDRVVILTRLPTLTPTAASTSLPAGAVAAVPTPKPANAQDSAPSTNGGEASTESASPVSNMTMTIQRGPLLPEGWTINGVRAFSNPDKNQLLLYGDVLNDTDTGAEVASITGTFYDTQSQVIPFKITVHSLPIKVLPPHGQLPFRLTVVGLQEAASYDLRIETKPSDETPHQNFKITELEQTNKADESCVTGQIQKPEVELQSYLVITLILYDGQDQVINFSDYDAFKDGAEPDTFQICANSLGQEVARHELRAWGL